ncbi:protein PFC0760c-like [Spodoptera frugiperda]|uniref:Protein PFC0760c-like n=1 Tax=Spodoptera frugiperda TaxID=7108 RepID=A0A9R0E5F4_SPOFR|nr:protein PFC0760c-like [Spodoptera frugiperda]
MNIYYAHCAVLIKIAEFNLKMSRSYCRYDEDWQRRKSILIRSLFHDLPILSPVTEEPDDSFPPVRSYEPLEEPQRPYSPLPPLIIERVPKINKHDEPEEYYKKLLVKIKRIYRRLFILNRNLSSDEEFFNDSYMTDDDDDLNISLANKNENNHDLNSPDNPIAANTNDHGLDSHIIDDINDPVDQPEEFNVLDDNKDDSQNQVNDNTNSNEDNVRKSSDSNVSNGYRADSESIDTVIVDILNYTKSTDGEASTNTKEDSKASKDLEEESESIGSEGEDESNTDNNEERLSANEKASDNESSSTTKEDYSEELIVEEEVNVSSTSNQETNENFITARRNKSIIGNIQEVNEQEMIGEESDDKSITNQGVKTKSSSNTEENILESHQQEELIEIRIEEEIRDKSSKSIPITEESNVSHQEGSNTLRKEKQNRFEDLNKSRMNIKIANEEETDNSSTSDEEWDGEESLEVEISVELSASALEEIENAQELEGEGRRIAVVSPEIMDDDAVEVVSDIGSHYRQITTVAMVHAAVSPDLHDIESQVYEGSPKSIILPVRRMKRTAAQAVLDRREESVGNGGNKEPRAAATTNSNGESSENIEEMRSHTRKLSQATNPEISQESVSEKNNEFIRSSHDVTDVTTSSQDGGNFNISKRKTSDDLGPKIPDPPSPPLCLKLFVVNPCRRCRIRPVTISMPYGGKIMAEI